MALDAFISSCQKNWTILKTLKTKTLLYINTDSWNWLQPIESSKFVTSCWRHCQQSDMAIYTQYRRLNTLWLLWSWRAASLSFHLSWVNLWRSSVHTKPRWVWQTERKNWCYGSLNCKNSLKESSQLACHSGSLSLIQSSKTWITSGVMIDWLGCAMNCLILYHNMSSRKSSYTT